MPDDTHLQTKPIELTTDVSEFADAAELTADGTESTTDRLPTLAVSRRGLLRRGAAAVAGGSLLTASADRGGATPHGGDERPLDVQTTDVELLGGTDSGGGDGGDGRAKTTGKVHGMDRVNCRRCRIGAQVSRAGHDKWYGGLQRVVTARSSFRVAVTLTGLRPGRFRFRLVACPVTHDHLCFGNVLTVVVRAGGRRKKKKKKQKHHKKKKKKRKKRGKCPCGKHHPDKHHLTLCGGDGDRLRDYAFMISGGGVEKSRYSCAPHAVGHHAVTVDGEDRIRSDIVTGALAGGGDSFLFRGDLTDMRCDDGTSVYLDGRELHY
ncbi:hypothetical protein [Halorussus lipolyticus]|uniref:hypothetical protein n=1 Tax=Halorussus lipolyticus TaxID=3034024 RepID=UPI0023E8F906|nr:hypothetical protein [Halorussus sp. DT80]